MDPLAPSRNAKCGLPQSVRLRLAQIRSVIGCDLYGGRGAACLCRRRATTPPRVASAITAVQLKDDANRYYGVVGVGYAQDLDIYGNTIRNATDGLIEADNSQQHFHDGGQIRQ